jgi:Lhr-like helicase
MVSSTNKIDLHDITEILLKVTLIIINEINQTVENKRMLSISCSEEQDCEYNKRYISVIICITDNVNKSSFPFIL